MSTIVPQRQGDQFENQDTEQQARLSHIAEVTAIVTHEFNNYLNGIQLHVALLGQMKPDLESDLAVIRQSVKRAGAMVKRLQQFNRQERVALRGIDLNQVVQEVLGANRQAPAVPVRMELADALPPVLANAEELHRLLGVLLGNAAAAMNGKTGAVTVRTARSGNRVILRLEDDGASIADDLLPRLFEPFVTVREGADETALAVGKLIARRLQGTIHGENRPAGGVAIEVSLGLAPENKE